ncbi:hypothetical protein GQ457_03G000530 [Hibiscus cannabinus]
MDEEGDNNKGRMWDLDQKFDKPMDEEAGKLRNMSTEKNTSALMLLRLAFQSLGVVYGDLGTSPLYVFYNTFPDKIEDPEDVVGALSLIIYSLTLVALLKYVLVVCKANDNGQGGTFALYSLLCRHANIKVIPNQHRTDEKLTTYSRSTFHEKSFAGKTKRWLENDIYKKHALLVLVLVGTCNVIGDGILTPAISVLSASGGIKVDHPRINNVVVLVVAVALLVALFSMQHYGTDKVSWLFAPVVLLWFLAVAGIGTYNIWKYDTSVLKAFLPVYIWRYFKRRRKDGWISLGGIMLSITGTEALFADLAFFPVAAVQLAFTVVVFPCLLLAYAGQAAYLIKNRDNVDEAFYRSIPGTAVVFVMLVTTLLMTLIMILVWRSHWSLVVLFTSLSLVVECTFISAVLVKIDLGGWIPLVIAAAFLVTMYAWHYGTTKRYEFEMHVKVSMAWLLGLGPSLGLVRVPGTGLVYTELSSGVPHIFSHFITNLPAIHSVVVFVCVKYLPVYTVPEEERFLVKRIGPKNFHLFRCVARYGYRDLHRKDDDFEKKLFDNLFSFVRVESMMEGCSESDESSWHEQQSEQSGDSLTDNENTMASDIETACVATEMDELEFLNKCREAGVVHILGNTEVRARRDAGICKKITIDYVYAFLRKICRENSVIFNVPRESLLSVGQVIYV